MSKIVLKRAALVRLAPNETVAANHSLVVRDGRIEAVAPDAALAGTEADTVIDVEGRLVLPGWVNAHNHFYSALACGLAPIAPPTGFRDVLENLWWRLDRCLDREGVYLSALAGSLAAIRAGCTTLIDHHSSPAAIAGSLDAIGEAVTTCGLRACLAYEVSDRDGPEAAAAARAENRRFAARVAADPTGPLRARYGLHAAFTLGPETLTAVGQDLAATGGATHVHLAEGAEDPQQCRAAYGARPSDRLRGTGALPPGSLAVHGVHLDPDEPARLAEAGVWLAYNPQSNLNNAVGVPDLEALEAAGVPLVLGTDGMTQNLLQEARVGVWGQRGRSGDPRAGFTPVLDALLQGNPRLAASLWGDAGPTLAEGAPADLAVYDYRPATPLTPESLRGHLLFGVHEAPVLTTLAHGAILMRDRQVTVVDEPTVLARCRDYADALWARFRSGP